MTVTPLSAAVDRVSARSALIRLPATPIARAGGDRRHPAVRSSRAVGQQHPASWRCARAHWRHAAHTLIERVCSWPSTPLTAATRRNTTTTPTSSFEPLSARIYASAAATIRRKLHACGEKPACEPRCARTRVLRGAGGLMFTIDRRSPRAAGSTTACSCRTSCSPPLLRGPPPAPRRRDRPSPDHR